MVRNTLPTASFRRELSSRFEYLPSHQPHLCTVMACRALDCTPQKGISLDALKLTYAAEGSDIGTYMMLVKD